MNTTPEMPKQFSTFWIRRAFASLLTVWLINKTIQLLITYILKYIINIDNNKTNEWQKVFILLLFKRHIIRGLIPSLSTIELINFEINSYKTCFNW
jgi:hypothetical protein